MMTWTKNEYDTLTTRPSRDAQFYLERHRRRRGLSVEDGGGRLARFGKIARYKQTSVRDVVDGRLDRVYEAEYNHYVWRVRPLCAYCNVVLTRSTLTRDHVVPRSAGGGPGDNLVPCCGPCNRAKADRSLLEFLVRRSVARSAGGGATPPLRRPLPFG